MSVTVTRMVGPSRGSVSVSRTVYKTACCSLRARPGDQRADGGCMSIGRFLAPVPLLL